MAKQEQQTNNQPAEQPVVSDNSGSGKRWWNEPPMFLLVFVLILAVLVIAISLLHNPKSTVKHKNAVVGSTGASEIQITPNGFEPKYIQVKPGTTVTWSNHDTAPHWVASDPYPKDDTLKALNSDGPLQTSSTFDYTFDKVGTYTYHDDLNPTKLQGTVVVK